MMLGQGNTNNRLTSNVTSSSTPTKEIHSNPHQPYPIPFQHPTPTSFPIYYQNSNPLFPPPFPTLPSNSIPNPPPPPLPYPFIHTITNSNATTTTTSNVLPSNVLPSPSASSSSFFSSNPTPTLFPLEASTTSSPSLLTSLNPVPVPVPSPSPSFSPSSSSSSSSTPILHTVPVSSSTENDLFHSVDLSHPNNHPPSSTLPLPNNTTTTTTTNPSHFPSFSSSSSSSASSPHLPFIPPSTPTLLHLPLLPALQPSLVHHAYHVGLLHGQFADTLLTITSVSFSKIYQVHALILAQEPMFLHALLPFHSSSSSSSTSTLPPLSGPNELSMSSTMACATTVSSSSSSSKVQESSCGLSKESTGLGTQGSTEPSSSSLSCNALPSSLNSPFLKDTPSSFLYQLYFDVPELATEEAMDMVLGYIYAKVYPSNLTPTLTVSLLSLSIYFQLTALTQHLSTIFPMLDLTHLPYYFPFLSTPPFQDLILHALLHHLHHSLFSMECVKVFSLLPWDVLKQVLESSSSSVVSDINLTPVPSSSSSSSSSITSTDAMVAGGEHFDHLVFEFTKKVLVMRQRPEESVVVTFGQGKTGLLLVRKGEKKLSNKKMWKVHGYH